MTGGISKLFTNMLTKYCWGFSPGHIFLGVFCFFFFLRSFDIPSWKHFRYNGIIQELGSIQQQGCKEVRNISEEEASMETVVQ